MYSWMDVARRTEAVYDRVRQSSVPTFAERLRRYSTVGGTVAGWLCCFTVSVMYLVWRIIEWVWPRDEVEIARDFPSTQYMITKATRAEERSKAAQSDPFLRGPQQ